jgi:L-ascorbate peroxidase
MSLSTVVGIIFVFYIVTRPTKEQRYKRDLQNLQKELTALIEKTSCNPIMLRLAWSDAVTYDVAIKEWPFCGGVNGTIRFDAELNRDANAGLSKAISLLTPIKRKYGNISWADAIQMAAVVGIKVAGGPDINLTYGREDALYDVFDVEAAVKNATNTQQLRNVSSIAFKHMQCPVYPSAVPPYPDGAPTADVHIRNVFYRLGLNNRETVALCGGHTLGRAFKDRTGVCAFSSGDQGATIFTQPTACAKVTAHADFPNFAYN